MGSPPPQLFSVRIVSIDYYMASPISGFDISYSTFHGGKVNEVPVIRIYGSTPAGQKTCLHVHQVLPYLYVPCSDLGPITNDGVDSRGHSISLALEKALKLKGNSGSKRQHVHGSDLVRARKFYGYHSSEELFVKIYFYYPQDVSRAANLLLAGSILDKNLQPYESHIPFLLQFLIDYNLYGMGHLHVSKTKFRYPFPDAYSQRKFKHNGKLRPSVEKSTCMNFQADLGGDLLSDTPIWTSSTIPDEWMWPFSSQPSSSASEDVPLFKRQCTSELEADALAQDIINQQSMSYATLSQTDSGMKMVQSLIPIWEEEYERNGVSEVMLLDPEKPLPEDVLRNLSDEVEFEKFMEENWSLSTPEQVESSTGCGDFIESGAPSLEESNHLPSNFLKASDKIGSFISLDSPLQKVDTVETNVIDATDQLQLSGSAGPSTPKDEDALRLLKWFASSQAAEDINSDDELAHETILSPLLPSKDIDKVLERASVDYESESQKECQDILDSIVVLNVEELESRAIKPAEYSGSRERLSNKFIPQVDGSSDDLQSTPRFDESLKTEHREAKSYVEGQTWPELDPNLVNKRQSKRPRWGSLPVISQKVSEVSHPNALCNSIVCNDEIKGSLRTSSNWNESEKLPLADKKDVSNIGKSSVIVECSSRDLMRKKRSCRIEISESRSVVKDQKAESCSDAEFGRGVINLDSQFCNYSEDKKALASAIHKPPIKNEARFHQTNMNSTVHEAIDSKPTSSCLSVSRELHCLSSKGGIDADNLHRNGNPEGVVHADCNDNCSGEYLHSSVEYNTRAAASSCKPESSLVTKTEIISEDFGCRVMQTGVVGSCTVLSNVSPSNPASNTDCTSERARLTSISDLTGRESVTTSMQYENSPSRGRDSSLYKAYDTSKSVNKEADTLKLIGIAKKPPIIDSKDEHESEAPVLIGNGGSDIGLSHHERSADVCLPFIESNCPEELEGNNPKNCEYVDNREPAMVVPVLYKNDGSCLYMFTPAISPPSRESVERWLSSSCPEIFRQKIDSPFLPASEGVSSDTMDSQGSQADDCKSSLPESASLSKEEPKLNQLPEHNKENYNMKGKTVTEAKKNLATGSSQDTSQISGPDKKVRLTPLSQIGFRDPASVGQGQQLTLLSIEVQAESRGDLRPNPRFDAINVIVLVLQEDDESAFETYVLLRCDSTNVGKDLDAISDSNVFVFREELQLFNHFTKLIHTSEPDVLMGWDVQSGSLGFLAERAAHLGVGLLNNISRTPSQISVASGDSRASEKQTILEIFSELVPAESVHLENSFIEDEWGRTHASGVHVGGRIVLNIWRLMRNEVKLNMYTVEAVAETVLRRKVPYIPWKVLTRWFSSGPGRARYRSIDYILERAKLNLQIMNQLDMINRTSELARVFGIDFFSVLSRGSQYRVESMFLRLAHSQNYLAISPGSQQVVNQPAMECLPLVMEPESKFYADPVIVLDFQSLYPSMVIAYNLCFCTCLGKVTPPKAQTLGVGSYSPDLKTLRNLIHELLVTPNGVVYVPSKVRKGILPRLLEEILSTRIMVKQAMKKLAPSQKVLHRISNARQLALKLISNVTYGYTAAGFSGRMPCAELADSIVQCGRRTLEAAISLVNSNDKWKARVIYGDTDSMFVLLKGRSLQEAFTVGHEIASEITKMNPSPVTLKMEKVYYPCFLLTKKRYVGYSYESPDQAKPTFDAKGTETIRRDTCVAVSKTMEQSLRIYFESQDIDKVKAYVLRQWTKIISGRFSLQDFVFAKEVRLGTYAANAYSLPPAAIVASKSMRNDPRAEPRYAERIPYVVIHGEPGARLVDMVVDPLELLALNSPFRLNDMYYIRKQIIPALQRVFGLVGADLNQWFLDMPRPARESVGKRHSLVQNPQKMRIDYYYASKHCVLCGDLVQGSAHLCQNCSKNETTVGIALTGRTSKLEKDIHHLAAICRHCGGGDWLIESGVKCTSLACSVFYERMKVQKELQSLSEVATRTGFYPKCMVEWF